MLKIYVRIQIIFCLVYLLWFYEAHTIFFNWVYFTLYLKKSLRIENV